MFLLDDRDAKTTDIGRSISDAVSSAKILIVDDNIANVELLREILSHHGYTDVTGETDPRRFEALCRRTEYDILLLDVRMPHLSGFDLIELTKTIYADTFVPILVLTAQTDLETRRKSLQLGANDFLNKPFVAWELLHRIRNALSTRILYREVACQNRDLEHRVEERTAALSDALVAAQEGERAKLDFLSMISHELRTPLNSIIGFAEVMSSNDGFPPISREETLEYAQLIESNGRGLLAMVNNLLDFTRAGIGGSDLSESEFALRRLLEKCLEEMTPKAASRGIILETVELAPLVIRADRRRMKQVLIAVLDNAIKFNIVGGFVRISLVRDEEWATLRIADTGHGVAEEMREKVFTPFFQGESALQRQHEGIGLGLPMVRRYVEMHGGRVWICGDPEEGTELIITLPAERIVGQESACIPPSLPDP